ncbi:hypothetical protein ON010_g14613 [Phytophthora cinnamomi]|nr:hypothetical protein ON010_g14613 [Phytophthora cinnamomi]
MIKKRERRLRLKVGDENHRAHERERRDVLDREEQERCRHEAHRVSELLVVDTVSDGSPDGWADNGADAGDGEQHTDLRLGEVRRGVEVDLCHSNVAFIRLHGEGKVVDHVEKLERDELLGLAAIEEEAQAEAHSSSLTAEVYALRR